MKQHQTITLVSVISLAFFFTASTLPSWIGQRTAAAESVKREPSSKAQVVQGQADTMAEASAQNQSVPVLTRQNAPDLPQCREILNQAILDLVNTAAEDPAETFEKNRRAHPHMIMMPPPLDCASKLWVAVRQNGQASESAIDRALLSLRQHPIESVFDLGARNASVGTDVDLGNGVEGYQGENSISIDPNNPLHLIAFSNTFYKDPTATCQSPTGGSANTFGTMSLFGSTDGGATWTYNCAPWPAAITGGVTGATFWFGSDPALSWDGQGRAYACYMLISQSASASGAAIVVARSADNGASWQSLGTVVNGIASTTQGNDKEMMAIDNTTGQAFSHPGRIYVIWDAANAEKIAFSDNGAAWTTVNFPSNTGAIGGNVVVGADGTVYVIWSRYNVETIVFSKSTDGGATWTAPQIIATLALQSFGTNNTPPAQDKRGINGFGAIDIDRNPASVSFGNLYVSFPDFPTGTTTGANLNTYIVRSTNGGSSWSARLKVNDDNFGATQIFPWLAVDQSDGSVNVSWYDSRIDPLNRQTQMVSSRSIDGGLSFEPNLLVTDGGAAWRNNVNYADENSTDNTTFNSNQYGDYSGIAAFNRQVHPLWTDSRMFFPAADTQSPTRREDNASSVLIYCSAPSAIAAPAVNSSTTPSVAISWSAPVGWGTNATNGTYSVFRDTTPVFPVGPPLVSDLTSTSYIDTTGADSTTYYYFIRAKNNCPGTALTAMSTDSSASLAVVFGSTGTPTGSLQGTVTAGGNPVSAVVVTAGTLSATTNASGFYLFPAIDAGTYTVSASPTGYSPVSISGVVITGGATTIQNLALIPFTSASCFTDTVYSDFATGAGSNIDLVSTPGDVKLSNFGVEATDQISSPAALSTTNNLSATTWTGQTFRAGITGSLKKISVGLGLASGTSGTITVEIRNLNGINPGTTLLATTTIGPVTNVGTAQLYTTTFATPAAVVSGTSYSVVLRTSVGNTVFGVRGSTAGGSTLANGQVFTTTNSGTTWTAVAADLNFTTYVTPPTSYPLSGALFSGVKDANPVVGLIPRWLTLSWNATTPANTAVKFQAAGSNSISGPFNFVGPDGTAATFFTVSGASLSQFNGFRYLKYQGLLSTTDNLVTPTLSNVTVCFDNDTPLITAAAPLLRQQAADVSNSQIAIVSDPGQAAETLIVTYTPTSGSGVTITNIIVDAAGNVTADIAAGCTATNSTFTLTVTNSATATAIASLTVNVTAQDTPTITPGGPTTFCVGGSVTLTSSGASGNQWYLNDNPIGGATDQAYIATASGNYTTTVTANGCTSAPANAATVTVNPIPATATITPGGPTTFCAGGSVTLTSSSASGNQWFLNGNPIGGASNQIYNATASGDYTDVVSDLGCSSSPSAATTITVNPIPATPTITPDGPTTFCAAGSVTLTSSSASGNQWYLNGNPIGGASNQSYNATASGNYTNVVTDLGCSSGSSAATTVTVNPIPATPTITPGGPTTFCAGGSVTLTSSSASGNQWYLNGNPIGGETNQSYNATASGNYTNVVTDLGCSSGSSAATTITVNPIPATPTITSGGPTTFCAGGSVTLTSNSVSGNQWYLNGNPIGGETNQAYNATAPGNYTNVVTDLGCSSGPSAATTVTVNPIPATPTITPGGPTTFCAGGSVTLTSSSASGNQWYLNGNPIGGATNQQYIASTSGDFTNIATAISCSSSPSAATAVTVNPIPATPTITPDTPTTLCAGGNVHLTSSSATGNQWYLNGNPIGGAINQQYQATAAGDYTDTVTTSGCTSAPSAATTLTANVPPILGYATPQAVAFGGSLMVNTTSASPSIASYAVLSVVPALTTTPTFDVFGNVSITNAQPGGSHTITVRATDHCGVTVDASFILNVSVTTTYSDPSSNCGGNTPCYNTIQAAIDGLTANGTVNVNGGTFNEDVNLSTNNTININGDTTINSLTISAGTLNASNAGSFILTLAVGNWTNNGGTFNPGTGSVSFAGSGQTIGGSLSTTFDNLTIGVCSVSSTVDQTVTGILTLNGDLTVGSPAKVIMPASATAAGAGDVIGNLERLGLVTGACAVAPCGNTLSLGNPNNQITITGGEAPTSILVNLTKSAPATYEAAVQRNYAISETGGAGFTATLRLHYLDSELNGNMPESALNLRRFNGTGWVAIPATRPVDTTNNWVESSAVTSFSTWTFSVLLPTAVNGSIVGRITTGDGKAVAGAVVNLSGGQTRKLITDASGSYRFDNVPTGAFYTVTPSRANYDFSPFNRSFSQVGSQTEAVFMAESKDDNANPLDTPEYFVRQQYLDVLSREPDEIGFNYWSDQINQCLSEPPTVADGLSLDECLRSHRTNVAAAFFISQEAQQTGSFIYDVYAVTLGRRPAFSEYSADRQLVVGGSSLDYAKTVFAQNFVRRTEFMTRYAGSTTAETFVEALIGNAQSAGGDIGLDRSQLISLYGETADPIASRAAVVRSLADDPTFKQSHYNEAFVLTEYFSYLRREIDLNGYTFWVGVLNTADPGNYRGMVCSFVTSTEYQKRFSSVVSHSNSECGQ